MRIDANYELEKYANYYDSYSQENNAYKYAFKLKDKIKDYKDALENIKNQPHLELGFFE